MTPNITTLPNGLRIVTDQMADIQSISLGIYVGTGSRFETEGQNGISHLLEHMLFKGTKTRTAKKIVEDIESVGGDINAYTSQETTAFYVRMLKQDTALGLEILADMLTNSTLDETELMKEKHVVIQEIGEAFDTPDDIIHDYFRETAYQNQAIGRPILGSVQSVGSFSSQDLANYVATHYHAGNMIVAAAGPIEHGEFVSMAQDTLGDLPAKDRSQASSATYHGGKFELSKELEQVQYILGFEAPSYLDDGYYQMQVLTNILGGGMSSRLFQQIREEMGIAYSIYSYHTPHVDTGLMGIYAAIDPAQADQLSPAVTDILHDMAKKVEKSEVDRAKSLLKAQILMALESSRARCERLGRQMLVHGRVLPIEEVVSKLDEIQAEDVSKLMHKMLQSTPTLACLGPIKGSSVAALPGQS